MKTDALRTDEDLQEKMGTDQFVSLKQVHGNTVVIVDEASHRMIEGDAAATITPNLWLTIRAADCQQIAIYAPGKNVIGIAHAGWKGLKAGVVPALLQRMKAEWGIDGSKTIAIAGPSLCTSCAEFSDPTVELAGLDEHFFHGRNADLRSIADAQLMHEGILQQNIIRSLDCTKCMNGLYWSYRGEDKEKVKEGWGNVLAVRMRYKE